MSTNELSKKVRELKELKVMAEELQGEITSLEDDIKAEMASRNTEEMTVDIYKVRWTAVKSSRFDTVSFKATHKDLYEQYAKQTTTRRFSVA